ncbi:hypothetical protein [Chryseobacterium gregarium]|uniref:hypothetical protein n=1 Tax=Chryseobacterium gregarium TaxID=456299 RepID=UPI00041E7804|nr:hypothetical protein [Chryseobacterium gregarium]
MKIKYILFYISSLSVLISCAGSDTSFLPQTIAEAKAGRLLFDIYKPDKKTVLVNNTEYIIDEAFTSTKFNSKRDKTFNKNVFNFIFKLKNSKTGKEFEYDFKDDFYDYINFYSENGGIESSNLSIDYGNYAVRNKLDTIKIGFSDHSKNENIITFVKIK